MGRTALWAVGVLLMAGACHPPADGTAWGSAPHRQRLILTRACTQGKLVDFTSPLAAPRCDCIAGQLQAKLSPKALAAIELHARGRQNDFELARISLPQSERELLKDPPKALSRSLIEVAARCL